MEGGRGEGRGEGRSEITPSPNLITHHLTDNLMDVVSIRCCCFVFWCGCTNYNC